MTEGLKRIVELLCYGRTVTYSPAGVRGIEHGVIRSIGEDYVTVNNVRTGKEEKVFLNEISGIHP